MVNEILTALGIVTVPTLGGVKAFFNIDKRLSLLEKAETDGDKLQDIKDESVMAKLDSISEKIDLRCDSLEQRLDRVERKVLNGEYGKSK